MKYTYKYAQEIFPKWVGLVHGKEAKSNTDIGAYRLSTGGLGGLQIQRIVNEDGAVHRILSTGLTPREFAYMVWDLETSLQERDRNTAAQPS